MLLNHWTREDPGKHSSLARPSGTRDETPATPAAAPAEADSSLSPQPTPLNSIQKHPNPTPSTPRHRPPPLVTSHGHDSLERRTRTPSPIGTDRTSPTAPGACPLLMPPPATPLEHARHQVVVAHHNLSLFLARHASPVVSSIRLAFFVVKMASLARPCWPYVVNPVIGAFLVVVAGMDLDIPAAASNAGPSPRRLLTRAGLPSRPDVGGVASRWRRDLRISLVLLFLHVVVMWAAFSQDRLCTVLHPTPAGWPDDI